MKVPKPDKMTMRRYCDRLRSIIVRATNRKCQLAGLDGYSCRGPLQDMHINPRTTWEIRYDYENNALCGCETHHFIYTYPRKGRWEQFIKKHFPKKYRFCFEKEHPKGVKQDLYKVADEFQKKIVAIKDDIEAWNNVLPFNKTDQRLIDDIMWGYNED